MLAASLRMFTLSWIKFLSWMSPSSAQVMRLFFDVLMASWQALRRADSEVEMMSNSSVQDTRPWTSEQKLIWCLTSGCRLYLSSQK